MTDARKKIVMGRWVKSHWSCLWQWVLGIIDLFHGSEDQLKLQPLLHTQNLVKNILFIYFTIDLVNYMPKKKELQDVNRSGEKKDRVGQIAQWAWPEESLVRMLLAQVLTSKTKSTSKKVVYGSAPSPFRRPDSGLSSWRAGLRQEMPNSICLSKGKLHPGLWSLVNCLDMKSIQKQPHAHMQSRGHPKEYQQVGTTSPAHISCLRWKAADIVLFT